jgi:hypothetical protein
MEASRGSPKPASTGRSTGGQRSPSEVGRVGATDEVADGRVVWTRAVQPHLVVMDDSEVLGRAAGRVASPTAGEGSHKAEPRMPEQRGRRCRVRACGQPCCVADGRGGGAVHAQACDATASHEDQRGPRVVIDGREGGAARGACQTEDGGQATWATTGSRALEGAAAARSRQSAHGAPMQSNNRDLVNLGAKFLGGDWIFGEEISRHRRPPWYGFLRRQQGEWARRGGSWRRRLGVAWERLGGRRLGLPEATEHMAPSHALFPKFD